MNIAIDYDGTYTADPQLWDAFIAMARKRGHAVTCVTMRHSSEPVDGHGELIVAGDLPVIYTGRKAKMQHCDERGIQFDIWIDDKPHWILQDGG